MPHKHTIGIIGAGMYGKVHIRHFQGEKRAEVAWVCSASETATRRARTRINLTTESQSTQRKNSVFSILSVLIT